MLTLAPMGDRWYTQPKKITVLEYLHQNHSPQRRAILLPFNIAKGGNGYCNKRRGVPAKFLPDGKEVAYPKNRTALKVVNLASKQSRTNNNRQDKNYSYADGDQYYTWSPDGKWFLVQFGLPERVMSPEVGLVAADGKAKYITSH